MKDETQALLFLAAAGAIFLIGSRLYARKLMQPVRVACLGDSLTAAGLYAQGLESLLPLGSDVEVFGYESKGVGYIYNRVDAVIARHPDYVVVLAGVNDLPGDGQAEDVIAGLARIYKALADADIKVVAVELTPWAGHIEGASKQDATRAVNNWIRSKAKVWRRVRTDALGDNSRRLLTEYDRGDGLHLSKTGHYVLARLIAAQAFGR